MRESEVSDPHEEALHLAVMIYTLKKPRHYDPDGEVSPIEELIASYYRLDSLFSTTTANLLLQKVDGGIYAENNI